MQERGKKSGVVNRVIGYIEENITLTATAVVGIVLYGAVETGVDIGVDPVGPVQSIEQATDKSVATDRFHAMIHQYSNAKNAEFQSSAGMTETLKVHVKSVER